MFTLGAGSLEGPALDNDRKAARHRGKGLGKKKKKKKSKRKKEKLSNTDARPRSSFQSHSPSHFPRRRPLSTDYPSDRFTECILKPGAPRSLTRSLTLSLTHSSCSAARDSAQTRRASEETSTGGSDIDRCSLPPSWLLQSKAAD